MIARVLLKLHEWTQWSGEPSRTVEELGEKLTPHLRFEEAWGQGLALLVGLGGLALIVWVYRREGSGPPLYRYGLAAIRFLLVLLTMVIIAEPVISVERMGLPNFVIMIDDSASMKESDQYADAKVQELTAELARAAKSDGDEPTRLAIAQGLLTRDNEKVLKALQPDQKIKLYLVSNSARPLVEIKSPSDGALGRAKDQGALDMDKAVEKLLQVEASGSQTNLGDGVAQVLGEMRGVMPTAIVLMTDGQTTDGETLLHAAEQARRKGVPLYTIGLGDPDPPRDIELSDLEVDEVVFADDLVQFQARLSGRGFAGQRLAVRLLELPKDAKDDAQGKELAKVEIEAPPDGKPSKVEIGHRPRETGEFKFVLKVDQLERERDVKNNRLDRLVSVRKEKLKVLLVEGEPRYEFRYLKEFLRREETAEVKVVLQSSSPEFASQDMTALPTFPASKDDLFPFDVIILGDVDPGLLSVSQMEGLFEFVSSKGGGLLFIAGQNFDPLGYRGTPLERLLPIQLAEARNPTAITNTLTPFRPKLTAEGRVHPIFRFGEDEASSAKVWEGLPELNWYFEAPRKQPAAFVLAEHPTIQGRNGNLPLIAYQFLGAGKTMFHAIDDTWLWRKRVGDRYFGRFWLQTARFLARSKIAGQKGAELTTDRLRYQRQQPVQVRVRFTNPGEAPGMDQLVALVENPGRGSRKVTLKKSPGASHIYEGILPPSPEGTYTVRLLPPPVLEGGMPTAEFRVDPPAAERERTQMNQAELTRAAELTNGKFYTPITTDTLLSDLPKPRKVPLDTRPPIPLWNWWPMLALFVGLITAEWLLRKRKQLV